MANDKWVFLHTVVKAMLLNTMTAANRLSRGKFVVKDVNDITSIRLKKVYSGIMKGYDTWVKRVENRAMKKNGEETHVYKRKGLYKQMFLIMITLMESDHIYEKLFNDIYKSLNYTTKIDTTDLEKQLKLYENEEELDEDNISKVKEEIDEKIMRCMK